MTVVTLSSTFHMILSPVCNKSVLPEIPALTSLYSLYQYYLPTFHVPKPISYVCCCYCLQRHPTSRQKILLLSAIATEQGIPKLRGLKQGSAMSAED